MQLQPSGIKSASNLQPKANLTLDQEQPSPAVVSPVDLEDNIGKSRIRTALALVFPILSLVLCADAQQHPSKAQKTTENEIVDREKSLVKAERDHDGEQFKRLLRDDLIYVVWNGWVFTKQDVISKMQYIDVKQYDAENYKVRVPAPDAALITYDLKAKVSVLGHGVPQKQYVSSLWVKSNGRWRLLLHQATPATHP